MVEVRSGKWWRLWLLRVLDGDRWRGGVGGGEEDGGGVVGDGEGFAGGEGGEGGAGDAEGAAVVGVGGGEVVAGEDGFFYETTAFFAAADGVLVV